MVNVAKIFREAGFEVRPCPPKKMSPEEMEHAQKVQKACNDYLRYLAKAYEISKHSKSTIKFVHHVASHHRSCSTFCSREIQRTR